MADAYSQGRVALRWRLPDTPTCRNQWCRRYVIPRLGIEVTEHHGEGVLVLDQTVAALGIAPEGP